MYNSVNHGSLNHFPILNNLIRLIEGLPIGKQPNSEYYNLSLLKIWSKNCHNFLVNRHIKIHCLHRMEKKKPCKEDEQAQLFVLEISMTTHQTQIEFFILPTEFKKKPERVCKFDEVIKSELRKLND